MADNQDDEKVPPDAVGRVYSGEVSPPITTPEAVASLQATRAKYAGKPGAVSIQVYFAVNRIDNVILQASMLAYTEIRMALPEDFDEIFAKHHNVPGLEDQKARIS